MRSAPRIELVAPRAERARYLAVAYRDIVADGDALETAFLKLPVAPSKSRLETWRQWVREGQLETLAEALIELHYDPAYNRSRRKSGRPPMAQIVLPSVDEAARDEAADKVARLVESLGQTSPGGRGSGPRPGESRGVGG